MTRLLLGLIGAVMYRRLGHDIDTEITDLPDDFGCSCAGCIGGLPWSVVDLDGPWPVGIRNGDGILIAEFDDRFTAESVVNSANK